MTIEFTDRYQALGIPYPDPATMCKGPCEGTGWFPCKKDSPKYSSLWAEAEKEKPTDDGWHFVKCPDCGGTGKRRRMEHKIRLFLSGLLCNHTWYPSRRNREKPLPDNHPSRTVPPRSISSSLTHPRFSSCGVCLVSRAGEGGCLTFL